jgi:RHS repeat-associated protein
VTINVAQETETLVSLANSVPAVAGVPPSISIPAGAVSAAIPVSALAEGSTLVTASVNGTSASSTVTVTPPPRFAGELAVVVSASATTLNVIVPLKATTGPVTVTNSRGTATSPTPFTVRERESFDIVLAPTTIQVPLGGNGATRVRLVSTGLNPYPYGALLSATGLPSAVSATFDRPTVALNQEATLTVSAQASAVAGSYPITVTATGISGLVTVARTQTLALQVLAAGTTTVSGRVLHAEDDSPFVGARVRLGGVALFTDETGTYRFVNPPVLGDQVLLIDGNTANTPQFEFPSGIAMPVTILAGQDNTALTSFIGRVDATKFTAIVPGQAATVTDPDLPGFALNIPAGTTITGWDGQPVTKINVRRVPVDRLPIRPLPSDIDMKSAYLFYFFREGGGTPTQPVPVTYPNEHGFLPGEQVELWYYDEEPTPNPNSHQWRSMGFGTVSADGKSIVSNPGVGIPKFCCGAGGAAPRPPRLGGGSNGGGGNTPRTCPPPPKSPNPVDLASGNAEVFRPRPFGTLSVLAPVNLNCRYRSTDPRIGLFGRGMSFTYDWFAEAAGNAARVTNPDGVQFMLSLGADGVYRATNGHQGAIQMELTPTASGRALKLADGTRYEFDGPGRLTAVEDVRGNRTSFTLDGSGRPLAMTDAAGKVYSFEISGSPPLVRRITDPIGRAVEFGYDASNRLSSYRDQGGQVTLFEYDAANRIRQMTDPRGAVKTIEYDAAGRAVRELLPEAAEERYAYSTVGNTVAETRHTDGNGNLTAYRFNGLGYMTSRIDALGRVTRYELDPVNNLLRRMIDPAGRVTQYFHNARGDVIRTIDPDNKETLIEYDARFRKPTRIENALGNVTTMVYDAQGNLTSLTNAENETTTFTYTPKGQLETVTDPLLRVTRFTYDGEGNLLTSTNPANETVTRTYDLANRLIELIDPLQRRSFFTYDGLDRLTEVQDAAGGITRYAYDANDNLLSATDPNGNLVERSLYDLRNRLKQRTDAKNRSASYEYDGVGNLVRMTDRKGQVTQYTYDAINRLSRIQDADGRTTEYVYDLAGNLARITDTQSGEILMSYDNLDRLTEVVTAQGTVTYAYDAIGRRTSRTLSGGDVTSYGYDRANRLKTVALRGRTATYTYDAAGRLTEKVLPNGLKATYQYDAADRVTSIAYARSDNTLVDSVAYGYDAAGQRVTKTEGQAAPSDTAFAATYDEANRLTSVTIGGESFALGYDDNGNLVSKTGPTSGATAYSWNARNQLVGISGPNGTASFKYDALGRRIEKTVNGATTGFLYDGAQVIAELRGSAVDSVYHTGFAIDEVLARYGSSGNRTLLTDALMSVIAQARDDQSVQNFYAYSPYGEVAVLGPDEGNVLRYTGREDDGTGLYYYRARFYDPILKRFVAEDPIGIAGGANLYAYVAGNPVNAIDPEGKVFSFLHPLEEAVYLNIGRATLVGAAFAAGYTVGSLGKYGFELAVDDNLGGWLHDRINGTPAPSAGTPSPATPKAGTPPNPVPTAQPNSPAPSVPTSPSSKKAPQTPPDKPWASFCDVL